MKGCLRGVGERRKRGRRERERKREKNRILSKTAELPADPHTLLHYPIDLNKTYRLWMFSSR